jgi:hypothetical protein
MDKASEERLFEAVARVFYERHKQDQLPAWYAATWMTQEAWRVTASIALSSAMPNVDLEELRDRIESAKSDLDDVLQDLRENDR